MHSTRLSRFTDDLVSQAAKGLDYELDFKSQSADEKIDTAHINEEVWKEYLS